MTTRALVLGAGGLAGVGWLAGMLYGLAEAGVDLGEADTVIGTSAGSLVGAQFTSGLLSPVALFERQIGDPSGELPARLGKADVLRFAHAAVTSRSPEAFGRRIGRLALSAPTEPEAERRKVIEARLVRHTWPDRDLRVTAVDTLSGALRVFDRHSEASVVDAVAASCAVPGVWPPVTIGGRRWMDGGTRSPANVQVAEGHARVVVLAPTAAGGGTLTSARAQAARLAATGVRVVVVHPDRAARRFFGRNSLDPVNRAPAAHAGRLQAWTQVEEIARVWRG
ncbi:patatin-like phospholipase family protein [Streptomyces sp. NA04227]|uniref:patatin-like phospholipase family protein n=1 Tax=Streptomyces sp. NA04227 TaxID=2742136 RepID=UPI00159190B1|nr:patatin-like phospholipase family protein [Streptomyces sp. NA04227]QKW05357.1 patatin-like phospholipase family protein [Streptomyces sp. NA04227]